jgi:hypothetical protein
MTPARILGPVSIVFDLKVGPDAGKPNRYRTVGSTLEQHDKLDQEHVALEAFIGTPGLRW